MSLPPERTLVLCIDDDPLILNALVRALGVLSPGVDVFTASNGAEALDIVRAQDVGVAFVDLIMPGMDGFELLNTVRQVSPNTEMVMITAEDDPASVVAAMKAGATDYLTKPLDIQRLQTVAANLVERFRLAAENRRLWRVLRQHREQAFACRPIRILVVEDNSDDALIVRRLFEKDTAGNYDIRTVTCAREVVPAREQFNPDCILLDYVLPDATGLNVLSQLSADNGHPDVAVVVLTGFGDEHIAAAAMRAGAADFLVKSTLSSELLHRTVFAALEKMDLMRKARKQEEETGKVIRQLEVKRDSLAYDADHDPLTGMLNRRGMDTHMAYAFRHNHRQNDTISLAMCDIDYFKKVNDRYGHQVGDEILIGVTRRMQHAVRDNDRVSRYGGEEFLLLIANSDGGLEPYERLRKAVAEKPFSTRAGEVSVTISIGVAMAVSNMDKGIAQADSALYDAKSRGRNQIVIASNTGSKQ